MSNKKHISLILAIMMVLQLIVPLAPLQAKSSAGEQRSEGQKRGVRSEIFEFKNTEKKRHSWFTMGTQSLFGARDVGLTKSEKVKIKTTATGLDDGTFNWEAFGQNKKFEAWIEVAYVGEKDDQDRPIRQRVSDVFDINAAGTINTTITVDASKTVDNYYIVTEYDKEPDSFKINAFFDEPTSSSDKKTATITFTLGIHQIVSTKITYNLIDEYGKAIDLNDAKEAKPADTDLENLAKIGNGTDEPVVTFNLKKNGTENLWQEQELDEFELMNSSLALSLTKNQVTSGGIDYNLTSTYDVINGGTVTIKRQKDAVTPKDPHNPGTTPEGYARINLVADETGNGSKGTFTKDNPQDTQRVVDVRAGKSYTVAKAEIDKQGKPFPLTGEKKLDAGKVFKAWDPELNTLGNAVAGETKTLNATYQTSKEEIIPYLPGEEEPTKDKDGLPIPTNYVKVTFKSEDATKGNVKIGDKEGATVNAKVKPGIDLSQKPEIKTVPAQHYGFTQWKPVLGKAAEGQTYTAYFVKSGEEIGEKDPIPSGWYRVTVSQDADSIQENTVPTKYYPVEPGDKLAEGKFPSLTNKAKVGYKDPAWYVGSDKVEKPYEVVINSSMDFVARATELDSHKITKDNGLNPVDFTAYKGDEMGEDFWKKGVALTTPDNNLQKLLDAAKVTDATKPARTTETAGEKTGTLKVTFKDGSTIEVQNQKLTVKETEVKISFDKDANDDANAPRAKEEVVKGKISAADESTVIDGATIVIKDKEDKVIGRGLANDDGSFVVGTRRPLIAGENLKITVTLPGVEKSSTPVEKQVKLNPDDLNKILPVGDKLYENLKGKPGVSKAKLNKLKEAVDAGYKLVPKAADQMAQKPATSVALSDEGQKSLDGAADAIKAAIKAITDNTAPVVTGTAFKEIFKGEDLNLEDGITVTDADSTKDESDIEKQEQTGKDFSYKVYTTNSTGEKVEVTGDALKNLNKTPGTYEVVYMAKDKSAAEGTFTMTLVVKDIVYTKIAVTTDPAKTNYLVKDKDTKATVDYTGTVVTLTKNNGTTETATYDKASGKFKIGEKAIDELTIAPKEVTVAESPAVVTATYKAGKTELTAKAGKNIIVQIDSDGNGKADSEENFDIKKAKTMEITNQPILNYELDHKTGKATLDLKPLVVKVTDSLGNFKYFGYEEIKSDAKFALALGTAAFDKATAKELTTADTDKKVKVTLTYKAKTKTEAAKTLDAETSAIKVEDKRPSVIENPTPGEKREGYVSVTFNAGEHGGLKGVNTFLVKKDTASTEITVPTIVPAAGYKKIETNDGWDKPIPATFAVDFTATAQYGKDVETSDTPKTGYTPITFDALDKGKIGDARTKTIYVNPAIDVNLSEKAPTVTAETGYSFKAWNPAIDTAKQYTKEERILATYTSDELISDKEKKGYIKVTFDQGKHGKFNVTTPAQKTNYWVKPDTLVDLRAKEPKVTANAGYIHTGWSPDLVVNFKANAGDQTITAQYGLDSDYSTTKKAGYTEITFDKGANGDFAKDAKTKLWVNPAKELTLPAPGIVPHPGYSHTGWTKDNAAVNLSEKAKYTTATTITAAYESDISESEKTGYVKVSFDADKNGTIANDAKKDFWVNPNKEVNLTDKAPTVTPNSGYIFIKWDHKLVDTFKKETTIKATYASAGDIKTEETDGFTKVTFDAGQNGKFAEGAQVTYWVNPDKELVLPEPRVIPNKGFEHTGWDQALTPAKKYAQETTIKATYKEEISTTKVDGHQEIKFLAGDDGTFADGKKEYSIWVKPDTLVDLRKSAPEVTVTTEGKTFTGWDKDLVGTFKLEKENGQPKATVFKAQYSDKVSDTKVEGWTEITFKAGEHGKFGTDGTTPIVVKKLWVDPKAQVALNEKAPKVTAYTNWLFDKWMDGNADATLSTPTMYKSEKTFTATYKSVFSDKQEDNNVLITFKPGDNGRFADGAKTTTYVEKNVAVDLTEKAPLVIPNQNYGHKGWDPDLKGTFTQATDITAQYEKGTFKPDELASIDVFGPTKLSYAEGEKINLDGLKIVVKDKAGIIKTYEGAQAIKDAGFTIAPAKETPLTIKDHDKQPIKVSKDITVGQNKKTIEGQTVSTLSVSKNKSAEPTNVLARNLGENPQKTTVTGKAPKDSVIKVTDIDGKDLTDGTEVKAGANNEFTVTLKEKLAPGTPVKVTSTEPGKTESSPVVKQVFEDVNKDGTDDEKQKSAMPTDVKALNQNIVENGKVTDKPKTTTTVTGKAKAGAVITITDKDGKALTTEPTEVKADQSGNFTAEIPRQNDGTVIKVIVKEADKPLPSDPALASVIKDADNDGDADGDRVTLRPSALARNIGTGTETPKTPATFTTVEGDTEKDATVTVSYTFNGQAKTKVVKAETEGTNGLYTYKAELDDKLPAGTKVTVKAVVVGKKESTPTEAVVFEDLDGDKKPDGQGELDFTKIVEFKLASNPDKMEYALASAEDKDKATLDLTGLKVFLKDASGNTGIYEYNKAQGSPFEELNGNTNFKLELVDAKGENPKAIADGTTLTKANDANKIKVTVMNGLTPTDKADTTSPLNVFVDANGNGVDDNKEKIDLTKVTSMKVISQPELNYPIKVDDNGKKNINLTKMVVAVSDGVTTANYTAQELLDATVGEGQAAKKAFKLELVKGTAEADPTTKDITSVNGIELTTANNGNKVHIALAAKTDVKTETEALKVFKDFNNDGNPDGDETDAPVNLKALNVKEDKFTTITGKAKKGEVIKVYGNDGKAMTTEPATVTVTNDDGTFTIKVANNGQALDLGTTVLVTAQADKKKESSRTPAIVQKDADGNGIADEDETTTITSVIARNIGTGTTSPKAKATFTTIEGVAEKGSTVTIKFQNETKTVTADAKTGKYKLELNSPAILLDADTVVKASAKFGEKKDSPTIETKVFEDLDADGKADDSNKNKTERPSALAYNFKDEDKTTIKGEAEPGAKVVAKVGETVVGEATANSDGKYEISATKDNAKLPKGTKVSVTATLAPKGESPAQETVVFDDLDGDNQPDTSQAFDKDKIRGLEVVASPNKMVYNNKEHLNLTGMKVKLTDQMDNMKIVEFSEFETYGITVSPLNNIELSDKNVADGGNNGQKIKAEVKVAIGNNQETYSGETPTALVVYKDQTAKPTDVTAANQGTDTATKVRFKAADGAAIKIYKADDAEKTNLINGTPVAGTGKDAGYLIATLKEKLPEKTLIEITAQETGKKESSPEQARVIRDKNSNWEGGKTINLSAPVISQIREKDKKVTVDAPKAEDKIQTIVVEDPSGNSVTLVKATADKTWTVQGSDPAATVTEKDGKIEIPVEGKLPLKDRELIKVTFKDGETPANEAFDRRAVQKASQKPIVDQVYTGDENVKIADPTRADETATTIKVKVNKNDSLTIEKQADGSWKIKEKPDSEVKVEDGKVVVKLDPKAVKGDTIEVKTINDSKVESPAETVIVKDRENSTKPSVNPVATNDTKITGTAGPNADIVITITPKDGSTPKEIAGKADKDGNFTVPAEGLKDGDKIVAKATEKDKAEATSDPVTVGVDKSKLIDAINDGNEKLKGKDPKDYTPADKKLKEAIDEGEKVKDNTNADQDTVNKAITEINNAIKEKEATDKALDELKKAKEELDKTIEDAEKDEKPDEAIEKGQDASDTADTVIKNNGKDKDGKDMTSEQIKDLVEKTKEENRKLRLPVIQITINTAINGESGIVFTTNPGRCKVKVIITHKDLSEETYDAETGPGGTGSILLDKPLKTGDSIMIKATRITEERPDPDYIDNYTSTRV